MESRTVRFTVTEAMLRAFARLSGDFNSLHMDEDVARKSRYRRRIVHGMLPLSFLQLLNRSFPGQRVCFEKLRVRFRQPIHTGVPIDLEYEVSGTGFKASWRRADTQELVTKASGRIGLREATGSDGAAPGDCNDDGPSSFLVTELKEATFGIGELAERVESFELRLLPSAIAEFCNEIWSAAGEPPQPGDACPNLLAATMLSTLVGMRLPGRYATFTDFRIEFEQNLEAGHAYELLGTVEKVHEAAELLHTSVALTDAKARDGAEHGVLASGSIDAMVNAPPRKMLRCEEIRERHVGLGLDGKVVVITGASRGIGETTAKLFAMLGSKVVVNYYRGEQDAFQIAEEIRAAGGEAVALQCDVRDEEQVASFFDAVVDAYGTVDILVNNAVKEFSPKAIPDSDWEDFLGEMEVSVRGMHACCRAAIPLFKKSGRGKIVNLSTVAVDNPVSGQSRYITAKSAVVGYTKSLAVELAKHDIQANVIVPNMTDTDLVASIPTAYREKLAQSRPGGRHVEPVEVAQAVAFVASSWANAITGQKVVLNLGEPPFA